jgi:hypothetical protein
MPSLPLRACPGMSRVTSTKALTGGLTRLPTILDMRVYAREHAPSRPRSAVKEDRVQHGHRYRRLRFALGDNPSPTTPRLAAPRNRWSASLHHLSSSAISGHQQGSDRIRILSLAGRHVGAWPLKSLILRGNRRGERVQKGSERFRINSEPCNPLGIGCFLPTETTFP